MRKADGKNTNGEKTEGKRKPRSVKKMFVISLFALAGLAAVIFFALVFSDAYTLTHPEKVSAKRFPDDSDIGLFYEAATVTFENGDKTVLWYIPAQDVKTAERKDSDITVIFSHDCGDNKTVSMIDDGILYAKQLVGEGINVVTLHLRSKRKRGIKADNRICRTELSVGIYRSSGLGVRSRRRDPRGDGKRRSDRGHCRRIVYGLGRILQK